MDIYKTMTGFTPNTNQPELRVGFVTWLSDCDLTSAADITPKQNVHCVHTYCLFILSNFQKTKLQNYTQLRAAYIISILQNQIIKGSYRTPYTEIYS